MTMCSLGSPLLAAAQASVASRASVTVAEGTAHPVYFIFQQCCSHKGPLVGISCYGQSFLTGVSPLIHEPVVVAWFLAWKLAWGLSLGMPAGLCLGPSPGSVESNLHQRCSLRESRISWQICASVSSLQSILPGNLLS